MAEVADVQRVGEVSGTYTAKQLFGRLKTFEDFADVVFYVPFVYTLVRDSHRTNSITDVFSHSLMQILGSHPLVMTELSRKVFEVVPPIILSADQKGFERTVYITPKEAWQALETQLQTVTAVDRTTHRFCIFRMYEEEVPCPLGNFADRKIKIWYCNLYGNKETYCFTKERDEAGGTIMRLHYSPPIKEVVDWGDYLLNMFRETTSEEKTYSRFTEDTQGTPLQAKLQAIQKNDKLQKALAAKPLEESQLTARQRADINEMIKMYYQLYGEQT